MRGLHHKCVAWTKAPLQNNTPLRNMPKSTPLLSHVSSWPPSPFASARSTQMQLALVHGRRTLGHLGTSCKRKTYTRTRSRFHVHVLLASIMPPRNHENQCMPPACTLRMCSFKETAINASEHLSYLPGSTIRPKASACIFSYTRAFICVPFSSICVRGTLATRCASCVCV